MAAPTPLAEELWPFRADMFLAPSRKKKVQRVPSDSGAWKMEWGVPEAGRNETKADILLQPSSFSPCLNLRDFTESAASTSFRSRGRPADISCHQRTHR